MKNYQKCLSVILLPKKDNSNKPKNIILKNLFPLMLIAQKESAT